jgi:signal transduction histidine kinase
MRQVLWNLVRNALQASPSRGVVRVGVGAHDDKATVWVEDDGAGIDDDAKARIFDAFYTTRAHGAGIGLAVVKRIVDDHQKHGAAIMVESAAPGRKGARFKISLTRVL